MEAQQKLGFPPDKKSNLQVARMTELEYLLHLPKSVNELTKVISRIVVDFSRRLIA